MFCNVTELSDSKARPAIWSVVALPCHKSFACVYELECFRVNFSLIWKFFKIKIIAGIQEHVFVLTVNKPKQYIRCTLLLAQSVFYLGELNRVFNQDFTESYPSVLESATVSSLWSTKPALRNSDTMNVCRHPRIFRFPTLFHFILLILTRELQILIVIMC
jgi:hypothetical protein